MPQNQFPPFGTGSGAVVTGPTAWATSQTRQTGFPTGIVVPGDFNQAYRTATFPAAVLAQWIADNQAADVLDNGNVSAMEAQFNAALEAFVAANAPAAPGYASLWHIGTATGGTSSAYTTTLTPAIATGATGFFFACPISATNTTVGNPAVTTIDFGLGPKTIVDNFSGTINTPSAAGRIPGANAEALFFYDGTYARKIGLTPADVNALIAASMAASPSTTTSFPNLVQVSSSQNYTPSAGTRRIAVIATGPGGPGGSCNNSTSGAGGGGGEARLAFFNVSALSLPVLCTIGASSAPSSSYSGSISSAPSGTPTTFGSLIQANPGAGGTNGTSIGPGALGGSGGSGGISFPGAPGEGPVCNFYSSSANAEFRGGGGGGSFRSGGGLGVDGDVGLSGNNTASPKAGGNAPGPGGGGGGADSSYAGTGGNVYLGGTGGSGEILILELV